MSQIQPGFPPVEFDTADVSFVGASEQGNRVWFKSTGAFGVPNEAHIFIGDDGHIIRKVIYGSTLGDALATVRFDTDQLHDTFRRAVMHRIKDGELSTKEGNRWIEFYEDQTDSYTYLTPNGHRNENGKK